MFIHQLAQVTGVPAKTIRYYESIGLLPRPPRAANNYRQYAPDAVERLRFISSARRLGFGLADLTEILAARDGGTLPCRRVIDSLDQRLVDIDRRLADLLAVRDSLRRLRAAGAALPPDQRCDDACVCDLITSPAEDGRLLQPEDKPRPDELYLGDLTQ